MTIPNGYICFVLHAHLPFVRHPEHDHFLEERWLYEAITESYIPLLNMAERLHQDGVPFRLSISISPSLREMLLDPLLQSRYENHLQKLIELSEKEKIRTKNTPYADLAILYHQYFIDCLQVWNGYDSNILNGFKKYSDLGYLEIFTTCATHGFLPVYRKHPEAIRAQIRIGLESHKAFFGRYPGGMWLPECAYFPGLERILSDEGVGYFFVERHGIEYATPCPYNGIFAPIFTPEGVAVFGRDPMSSEQVWSAEVGYPGNPCYREFYRDIGYDLDHKYVSPYINPDGARVNTGIKYHSITGKTNQKALYDPKKALLNTYIDGADFLSKNAPRLRKIRPELGFPPLVVAPYDAELFGHWWFEGPLWLEAVFRQIQEKCADIQTITPSEYLSLNPTHQIALPATSTWGKNGYGEVWINDENSWIYRHLIFATEEMTRLANKYVEVSDIYRRALNQAGREILLAQSSDWPFLIHTGTATDYAKKRVKNHLSRFLRLVKEIESQNLDIEWLEAMEYMDNIFSNLNYRIFAS